MSKSPQLKARWFLLVVALVITTPDTFAQASTPSSANNVMDHRHLPIAVPATSPIPRLSLGVYKDTVSGLNLELKTKQFALMPPPKDILSMTALMTASTDEQTGFIAGHAHLYINGEKIQRVYGNNIHLPSELFRQGINQLTITLNSHGHMYWTVDRRKVLATLFINLNKSDPVVYRFESSAVKEE